jgi:ATP-dependent DNA helicase RecG
MTVVAGGVRRMRTRTPRAVARDAGASAPVETLPGIGGATASTLRARGIDTVEDLAWLLPVAYRDDRVVTPVAALVPGAHHVVEGTVADAHVVRRRGGRGMTEVTVVDDAGARLRLVWFKAFPGSSGSFPTGARVRAAGTVEAYRGAVQMAHAEVRRLDGERAGATDVNAIVPRYTAIFGVPPRRLRRAVREAAAKVARELPDAVPAKLRAREGFGSLGAALAALHAPPSDLDAGELVRWNARDTEHHRRLALEELFLLELALGQRQAEAHGVLAEPLPERPRAFERALQALPFRLTSAQARVLGEIREDLARERPMRRILQGDVGSGKTAVALLAAAHAIAAGTQAALMAPTEILAEQHFRALRDVARAMGFRAALSLGGERSSHRRRVREELAQGRLDFVVGTHALLSEGVAFQRLRLVIVDEQHRFGVAQRLRLVDKGSAGATPHLLVMTATPIPRTLALALYGDLAASVLDEMPPGRVPPVTRAYASERRQDALVQVERALGAGGQAYVVCPTIDPVEDGSLRCANDTFVELRGRFGAHDVVLLHGRLDQEARDDAMQRFVAGEARVLVTTTIIEVGVDVPRANVVLVDHAERFGLAQLHQLRGRVGRAGQKSACLLVHDATSDEARARVAILCETHDGFRIAEEDLRLRGPGELFGRRQSGLPGFRYADLRRDLPLLETARRLAREVTERDPDLSLPEHAGARTALARLMESDCAVVKEEAG